MAETPSVVDPSAAASAATERDGPSEAARSGEPQPSDGGWAWVVLAGAFASQLLVFGFYGGAGVYVPVWMEYFDALAAETSLIISLSSCFMGVLSIVAGVLISRFGARRVWMAGGLITSAGLFVSALATSTTFLMFSMSFVTALGFSMCVNCGFVALGQYFKTRLTLAVGLASAGFAAGQLVLGPLFNYLIDEYGWRGSLIIYAGVLLHMVAAGALVRPPSKSPRRSRKKPASVSDRTDAESHMKTAGPSESKESRGRLDEIALSQTEESSNAVSVESPSSDDSVIVCIDDKEILLPSSKDDTGEMLSTEETSNKDKTNKILSTEEASNKDDNKNILSAEEATNKGDADNIVAVEEASNKDDIIKKIVLTEEVYVPSDDREQVSSLSTDSGSAGAQQSHDLKAAVDFNSAPLNFESSSPEESASRSSPNLLSQLWTFMLEEYGLAGLFRNPSFVLTVPIGVAHGFGWASVVFHLSTRAQSVGLLPAEGATLLTVMGGGALATSLLHGWIIDRWSISPILAYILAILFNGLFSAVLPPLVTFGSMAAASVLFGMATGVAEPVIFVVLQTLVRPSEVAGATSIFLVCWGVGEMVGATLAGTIYDTLNSYDNAYYMSGSVFVMAAILGTVVLILERQKLQRRKKEGRLAFDGVIPVETFTMEEMTGVVDSNEEPGFVNPMFDAIRVVNEMAKASPDVTI